MASDIQLQWVEEFTYQGVKFSCEIPNYIPLNLTPVVKQVKTKLKAWGNLPLSLLGRVNLIKMKILPKFNYLFRNSPQWIPKSFFTQLHGVFSSFVWGPRSPRFKLSTLMCPMSQGGLALPGCQKYYIATQLVTVAW